MLYTSWMANIVREIIHYHRTADTFSISNFADRLHSWQFCVIKNVVFDEACVQHIQTRFADSSVPSEWQERIVSRERETAYRLDLD